MLTKLFGSVPYECVIIFLSCNKKNEVKKYWLRTILSEISDLRHNFWWYKIFQAYHMNTYFPSNKKKSLRIYMYMIMDNFLKFCCISEFFFLKFCGISEFFFWNLQIFFCCLYLCLTICTYNWIYKLKAVILIIKLVQNIHLTQTIYFSILYSNTL